MEAQGVAFPYLMIQMYRSGEASGSMDKTALIMADPVSYTHLKVFLSVMGKILMKC